MSVTTCQHCRTAETADGLALCPRCLRTGRHALSNIAAYYADLDRVPTGGAPRRTRSATPDPTGVAAVAIVLDPVSAADDDATNTLRTWARALVDDRPGISPPPARVPELSAWLADHLGSVATLPWAGDLSRDLLGVERLLKRVAERARTGSYLGACGHDLGEQACAQPLYAGHDQRWVTCRCGARWDVGVRRQQLVRAAEDELAPVAVIARLAAVLTGDVSVARLEGRIHKWTQRGRVTHVGTKVIDGRPRRVYRVGDVLDLLTSDTPSRGTP